MIVGFPRGIAIILAFDEDVAGARQTIGFAIIGIICGDFAFRHAFFSAAFQAFGACVIVRAFLAVTDFRSGLFDARQICAANLAVGTGQFAIAAFGGGLCGGQFGAQRICAIVRNAIISVSAGFADFF